VVIKALNMHKRLKMIDQLEEKIDQDLYNALVSKLDAERDEKKQSFKCILKNVLTNYKQKIDKNLKIKNSSYVFSIQAQLQCASCKNFRRKIWNYLERCYCGNQGSISVIITNLGTPVKADVDVSIERKNLQLANIFNFEGNFEKGEKIQNEWQFIPSELGYVLDYVYNSDNGNDFVYGGNYFSSAGNLTLICNIKAKTQESLRQLSSNNLQFPGTFTILANKFSEDNINPACPPVDQLTDIILLVENNKIHCHKLVLGMTSKFFERMFMSNMKESKSNEIELKEIDLDTIKSMLLFMYRDEIEDEKITVDLLAAADMYEVLRLKNICSIRLAKTIDIQNVAQIWLCAYLHDEEDLAHISMIFMVKRWKELAKQADIRELGKKYPELLFTVSTLMAEILAKRQTNCNCS